jgi:hypothetical protein
MNRKKLYQNLEKLQTLLSKESIPLIYEALELFSPIVDGLKNDPNDLLVEGAQGQQKRQKVTNLINQVINKEKSLKYRRIIVQSSKMEEGLDEIKHFLGKDHRYYTGFLEEISEKLETFLSHYESHTRSYSVPTCISMSVSASELKTAISSTNQILYSVLNLSPKDDLVESTPRLDLYLSNVDTLKAFSEKLDALSDIYTELLYLYGQTESDYPIVIEHLEGGSLWIKIAGHTLTATVLTSILTTATGYYQDQFTQTGQLNQLPTSVRVAEDLLRISSQLEQEGIDTTEIKENIESATRKISKKLDILLGDQPVVEINDIEKNIGDTLSQKLLNQSKDRKLEHKNGS